MVSIKLKKRENTLGAIEMIKFFPLMCLYHEVHWYTDISWRGPNFALSVKVLYEIGQNPVVTSTINHSKLITTLSDIQIHFFLEVAFRSSLNDHYMNIHNHKLLERFLMLISCVRFLFYTLFVTHLSHFADVTLWFLPLLFFVLRYLMLPGNSTSIIIPLLKQLTTVFTLLDLWYSQYSPGHHILSLIL